MKKMSALLSALFVIGMLISTAALASDRNDSAVFVLDTSETIVCAKDIPKIQKIVRDMNQKFPNYVKSAGAMTFGHLAYPQMTWIAPVKDYDRAGLDQAFAGLKDGNGSTPIGMAVKESDTGLAKAQGKKALIIVSDGLDNGAACPVAMIKSLQEKYPSNLCVYTILMGNKPRGAKLMADMAAVTGCGKMTNASDLNSDDQIQSLVDVIFGREMAPTPPPPAPKPVVAPAPKPVPVVLDSDNDGVPDDKDQCPGTPRGAKVDARGCWVIRVQFKTGSSEILPQYQSELDEAILVLNNNPDVKVRLDGHTDNQGKPQANMVLSENRAKAARDYMVAKGIAADRLTTKGFGLTKPIATNNTEAGRALNRRVELTVIQ